MPTLKANQSTYTTCLRPAASSRWGTRSPRHTAIAPTLGIPLLRDGTSIGSLFLRRTVVRPFTDRQIRCCKTFADQAVIAIENARLFEAEQTRTKELTGGARISDGHQRRALRHLAVAEDLQPVFDVIAETPRLCEADATSPV